MAIAIGSSISSNFYNQDAYNNQGKAVDKQVAGTPLENDPDHQKKPGRKSSPAECETCQNRKYQDGSNEMDVSFKAPVISPPKPPPVQFWLTSGSTCPTLIRKQTITTAWLSGPVSG